MAYYETEWNGSLSGGQSKQNSYFEYTVDSGAMDNGLWRRGVMVITAAPLHSTKPELRFCAVSNPARGESEMMVGISDNGPG